MSVIDFVCEKVRLGVWVTLLVPDAVRVWVRDCERDADPD